MSTDPTKTFAVLVGRNIRRVRRKADMTQETLAFRSEVNRTAISLYENGERAPSLESFARIVGALGVPAGELLPGLEWDPKRGRLH